MRMGESLGAEHPMRLATALRVVLPRRDRAVPAGRADLHVHSIWSDGAQARAAIVRAAAGRVDVLAITDHDEIRGALEAREFARAHSELGIDVVIGEEVSTLNGHVLALWIEERVPPGLSAERTLALIHDHGGLAVAAHPFHPIPHQRVGYRPLATLIPHLAMDVRKDAPALSNAVAKRRAFRPAQPTDHRGVVGAVREVWPENDDLPSLRLG